MLSSACRGELAEDGGLEACGSPGCSHIIWTVANCGAWQQGSQEAKNFLLLGVKGRLAAPLSCPHSLSCCLCQGLRLLQRGALTHVGVREGAQEALA